MKSSGDRPHHRRKFAGIGGDADAPGCCSAEGARSSLEAYRRRGLLERRCGEHRHIVEPGWQMSSISSMSGLLPAIPRVPVSRPPGGQLHVTCWRYMGEACRQSCLSPGETAGHRRATLKRSFITGTPGIQPISHAGLMNAYRHHHYPAGRSLPPRTPVQPRRRGGRRCRGEAGGSDRCRARPSG